MKRPDADRPLIFAHRGANRVAPENTLPAFEAAIAAGADGVELDVQYCADGQLVVIHNPTLEGTTNGTGRVSAQSLKQLRALDAGGWFSAQFAGTQIPTLDEVLDLAAGRLLLDIELKALDIGNSAMGREVVIAVQAHSMTDQVLLSSFNPFALRTAKKAAPQIECALLLAPDLPAWMRWGITRRYSQADSLHPETSMVDEAYMAWARAHGMAVRPWTVNDMAEMQRLIGLGVDAVITDAPDQLASLLK